MNSTLPDHGVYVACLASYNNGVLFGEWLDLDQFDDKEEVLEAIKEILSRSPTPGAEEYAIHDYCGLPEKFGEWPNWDEVLAFTNGLKECFSEREQEAWAIYCDNENEYDFEKFREQYQGCWDTGADYAQNFVEDCYDLNDLPSIIAGHIDWEGIYHDMRCGGDVWDEQGDHGLHIFDNQ